MPGVIRDKEYDLTQGNPNSRILYVSANPNGEAEVVEVKLSQSSTARKKVFEFDFADLEIKGRGSRGNTVTKYPVRKVEKIREGTSTLGKLDMWYDALAGRLNREKRGYYLGKFDSTDQVIAFFTNGSYKISGFDLNLRYDPEKTLRVEKFNAKKPVSAVYVDGHSKQYMVKRFLVETTTLEKEFNFISEAIGSRLVVATMADDPEIEVELIKGKAKEKVKETLNLEELIDVKGWKALGNRLSPYKVVRVSLPQEEPDSAESNTVRLEDETPEKDIKKKQSLAPGVQQSLFAESHRPQKAPQEEESKKAKAPKAVKQKPGVRKKPNGGRAFGVGETIELEL
jgi:topoisomerase-4 subunit A